MNIEYIRCGDYYIPNLKLPEETRPIGNWGRMHRNYLKEHHPIRYNCLVLSGRLWTVLADLNEDLAAEQKARVTYDNILRLSDDPDVNNVIRFLREREIVHFQRFGEAMQLLREKLDSRNIYFMNPAIDI